MDWFLGISTFLVNSGLGWFKGAYWIWVIHALNAVIWIAYSYYTKQYGLIPLSIVTIVVDLLSGYKRYKGIKPVKKEKDFIVTSKGVYLKPVGSHATNPFPEPEDKSHDNR